MNQIATVESLWRYPVKSMGGEELNEVYAGFPGIYGDRIYAFHTPGSRKELPYQTVRELRQMVRYRPHFRHPEKTIAPPNLSDTQKSSAGATPVYGAAADFALDIETPTGEMIAVEDPALIEMLGTGNELTLLRSERALTDCRPLSLFSLQTAAKIGEEAGFAVDKRRFRANIYLDLKEGAGFGEDDFVGRTLRIGSTLTIAILMRDFRCMIITVDPETGEKAPAVLKTLAQNHDGAAGLYAAVLAEGMIREGDPVELLA